MGVDLRVESSLTGQYQVPRGIVGARTIFDINESFEFHFTDGTDVGQLDIEYQNDPDVPLTIAAGANLDIDLSNAGTLLNTVGDPLALGHVKLLRVRPLDANTASLIVGGHPTAAWVGPFVTSTGKQEAVAGGLFQQVHPGAGWLVTPTTGDILRINNPGADPATLHVFVAGVSV